MIQRRLLVIVSVLVVFSCVAFATDTENPLVTEVQLIKGDSTYRNVYLYNEIGMKTLEVNYVLLHGSWTRRTLTEWLYEDNKCEEQHMRIWKNNEWQPFHKIIFEYDDDRPASETHYSSQAGEEQPVTKAEWIYKDELLSHKKESAWLHNAWSIYSFIEYKYNENQQPEELSIKELPPNNPHQEQKLSFTYDDSQRLTSITTHKKTEIGWEESSMVTAYYKPFSTLKSSEILKTWDKTYSKWTNLQHIEYTYDQQNRLVKENYQYWNSMFWVNDLSYRYEYNKDNQLTKQTTYLPLYNDFRPAWSIIYSDFKYNKASLMEAKNEFWGGETDALYNTFIPFQFNSDQVVERGSQIRVSYVPVDTRVDDIYASSKNSFVRVYPNPSSAVFYFDIDAYNVSKWIVTDLSGKIILVNEEKQRSGVIDLGDMKPGVYLFQAFTSEGVKMQKLLKE